MRNEKNRLKRIVIFGFFLIFVLFLSATFLYIILSSPKPKTEENFTKVAIVEKIEIGKRGTMTIHTEEGKKLFFTKSPFDTQVIILGLYCDEVLLRLPHHKIPHTKLIFNRNSQTWKDFLSSVEENGDLVGSYPSAPEKRVYLY